MAAKKSQISKNNFKRPKRKKKVVLSLQQKQDKRRVDKLHGEVKRFFRQIGFEYVSTTGKKLQFGTIPGDIDGVYFYQNVVIVVEETTSSDDDHLRKKIDYLEAIRTNSDIFFSEVAKMSSNKFEYPGDYGRNRYKLFFFYATEGVVEEEMQARYPQVKYFGSDIRKYFLHVSKSIRLSARNDLYQFLKLDHSDIGDPETGHPAKEIESAVIIPEAGTGFPDGVTVLSFIMRAEDLLLCSYVLRKDSWADPISQYYQRLVDKLKIDRIRTFLASERRTFIDNIIVTLPNDVTFSRKAAGNRSEQIEVQRVEKFENVTIKIPYRINSIGIIDGQHRVFGHYFGTDPLEAAIALHRKKKHLFVTGIFYDESKFDDLKKRQFESGLFLQLNNTHTRVKTDLLQYIESLKSPLSPQGVATNVILSMNKRTPFKGLFAISSLEKVGIRTPTIIKYGLQQLVEISDGMDKPTLFKYWTHHDKTKLLDGVFEKSLYSDYISFCAISLSNFFGAVKAKYGTLWNLKDLESRILTTSSIIALIKTYGTMLARESGPLGFDHYTNMLSKLTFSFKKSDFGRYGSSHWPELQKLLEKQMFGK